MKCKAYIEREDGTGNCANTEICEYCACKGETKNCTFFESVKKLPDTVNHPNHYCRGGIETIDFIEAKELNYRLGNVVKYVSRAGYKEDALEDLKKAEWYLQREIAVREKR